QHGRSAMAVGVPRVLELRRIEAARRGRAAEEAAAEPRALLVGPVHQREGAGWALPYARPGTENAEPAHHAAGSVEPAAVRHGVDVRADRQGRIALPREVRPGVAGLVDLGLEADLPQELAEVLTRRPPSLSPAEPLGAVLVARPPGQLAQVGDHALGVDPHP